MCVPSQLAFVALPIGLLDSLSSLLINWFEPIITAKSYVSHIYLFGITVCFNSSGTHFVGTLDSSDHNNTLTLSITTQLLCPNVHNASVIYVTQIYYCLPAGWSGTCTLLVSFLLGVISSKEHLLVQIFIQDLQWVDHTILTLQDQIDSLATIVI